MMLGSMECHKLSSRLGAPGRGHYVKAVIGPLLHRLHCTLYEWNDLSFVVIDAEMGEVSITTRAVIVIVPQREVT